MVIFIVIIIFIILELKCDEKVWKNKDFWGNSLANSEN